MPSRRFENTPARCPRGPSGCCVGLVKYRRAVEWHATLTVLGASAELVGLGLVVFDVRDARRSAQAALAEYAPEQPMTFPVGASFQSRYRVEGVQPPLEER